MSFVFKNIFYQTCQHAGNIFFRNHPKCKRKGVGTLSAGPISRIFFIKKSVINGRFYFFRAFGKPGLVLLFTQNMRNTCHCFRHIIIIAGIDKRRRNLHSAGGGPIAETPAARFFANDDAVFVGTRAEVFHPLLHPRVMF